MEELRNLVNDLEKLSDENAIVKKLQEIERKILNEYNFQVGEIKIEPLLIEMYYKNEKEVLKNNTNKEPVFNDENVHGAHEQKDNFGNLYIHTTGEGGIDICLSNGEYYLSFLIKNALLNGVFKTQVYICEEIEKQNNKKVIPTKKQNIESSIVFLPRLNTNKGIYATVKLAAFPIDSAIEELSKDKNHILTLIAGHRKQWLISIYALCHENDKTNARELANTMNGSKIEEKFWVMAKNDFEEISN